MDTLCTGLVQGRRFQARILGFHPAQKSGRDVSRTAGAVEQDWLCLERPHGTSAQIRRNGASSLGALIAVPCCQARRREPTKKYLRMNLPSRPRRGPPQDRQVISRSVVGRGGASTRTILYFAAQFGHSNNVEFGIDGRL